MEFKYPHTITNCVGERIVFLGVEKEQKGDRLFLENYVEPGHGPVLHTHFQQDESLTVVHGRIGYQIKGQDEQFAGPGETITFTHGQPHRFWNAGDTELHCKGWIYPANSIVFFLSALYAAQNKSGSAKPETFDGAYLMTRYATEYDLPEIPSFVKNVILPVTRTIGTWLGKYNHFKGAPTPLPPLRF